MKPIEVTDANFKSEVLESLPRARRFLGGVVWTLQNDCPVVEQLATEFAGKLKVGKVDVDSNQQTSMQFGIRSIPTLLIFKNGKVVDQIVGAVPKHA